MKWHKSQQSALKQLVRRALVEGVEAQDVGTHDKGQRRVAVAVTVESEKEEGMARKKKNKKVK